MSLLAELMVLRNKAADVRYVLVKDRRSDDVFYATATVASVVLPTIGEVRSLPSVGTGKNQWSEADAMRQLTAGIDTAAVVWDMSGRLFLAPSPRAIGATPRNLVSSDVIVKKAMAAYGRAAARSQVDPAIAAKHVAFVDYMADELATEFQPVASFLAKEDGSKIFTDKMRNPQWFSSAPQSGWHNNQYPHLPPGFGQVSTVVTINKADSYYGDWAKSAYFIFWHGQRTGASGTVSTANSGASGVTRTGEVFNTDTARGGLTFGGAFGLVGKLRGLGLLASPRPAVTDHPTITLNLFVHGLMTIPSSRWEVVDIVTVLPEGLAGNIRDRKEVPQTNDDVFITVPSYSLAAGAEAWARSDSPNASAVADFKAAAADLATRGVLARGQFGTRLQSFRRLQSWHPDWSKLKGDTVLLTKSGDLPAMTASNINDKFSGHQFASLLAWTPFGKGSDPSMLAYMAVDQLVLSDFGSTTSLTTTPETTEEDVLTWLGDRYASVVDANEAAVMAFLTDKKWNLVIDRIEVYTPSDDTSEQLVFPSIAEGSNAQLAEAFVALKVRENKDVVALLLGIRDVEPAMDV